jgi:hypothetical protein
MKTFDDQLKCFLEIQEWSAHQQRYRAYLLNNTLY